MQFSVTATPSVRVIAPTYVAEKQTSKPSGAARREVMTAPGAASAAHNPNRTARASKPPVALEVPLTLEGESNLYRGFETRGIFVATWQLLGTGTEVDITFSSDDGSVGRAGGVVRWVREYHPGFPDTTPGMAVELVDLPKHTHAVFERFAARRDPLFYE